MVLSSTMVPFGTYCTRVRTCVRTVRTYVLKMLCHNFLIGKGRTCALRTTCAYVRTYNVMSQLS
jgi:hypothetical protein